MRSVDEIADGLYALPPASFTAARDEAAAGAREAGDRVAARRIAALKRPTVGAHLVNLLALRRPDVVADLIEVGEQIRAAQGSVSAADLRGLSVQRRAVVGAALKLCRTLASEAGSGDPTAAQLSEAEATLSAAMADESAAAAVRAGRVVKALSYAGFGAGFGTTAPLRSATTTAGRSRPPAPSTPSPPGAAGAPAGRRATAGPDGEPAATPETAEVESRREDERRARERLARAEAELAAARARERAGTDEMDRLANEITRLRGAFDDAAGRARAARSARQAAERDLASARRAVESSG
ncbi:MAG TPA: hypothetical protein VH561_20400 [Micromonosporaceae bacterium]|jgi:hypothetical protein